MKTKFTAALMTALLMFTACGGNKPAPAPETETTPAATEAETTEKEKKFDCDDAGQEIITEIDFPSMIEVERSDVSSYLNIEIPEGNDFSMYVCASGGFSDEFLIVQTDGMDTAKLEEAVTARVSERYSDFEDYVPEEAEKLNNAIVTEMPGYFMYFVTADNDRCVQIVGELLG